MTVIEHDFGKKDRDTVKRFTQLMSLEAKHEASVLANPIPYLERANERMSQLEMAIMEAARAALEGVPSVALAPAGETVTIEKADYERLLQCKTIIEKAYSKL
jgi:hypothetical protein